jgi:hypothetical protein
MLESPMLVNWLVRASMCPLMAFNCSSMRYQRFADLFLISAASLGTFFLSIFFFFHKELFRLQATLEFRGVELDTCFA